MKANIVIRHPLNLGCAEAAELTAGDKIVCRRCGEGVVELAMTPGWGEAVEPGQFRFQNCADFDRRGEIDVRCRCGGLLMYSQPIGATLGTW